VPNMPFLSLLNDNASAIAQLAIQNW
jgi:hypothetical protein